MHVSGEGECLRMRYDTFTYAQQSFLHYPLIGHGSIKTAQVLGQRY